MSPHQMSFFDLLQFLKLEGSGPGEMNIIGIIPEKMDVGTAISKSVENGMNDAVTILLKWLEEKQGICPVKNTEQSIQPDYWWLK
jgi:hydrogenase maturation protease